MLSKLSALRHKAKPVITKSLSKSSWTQPYTLHPMPQIPLTALRSFSTRPNPLSLLKISENPYLYVDIQSNPYQQKVWAKMLKIPEDFVQTYFDRIKKITDSTGDTVTGFDPKRFTKDTPKKVVEEYVRQMQQDLLSAWNKYGDKKVNLEEVVKTEGIQAPKLAREDMPKFQGYEATELTESEKLDIEYEKDVFEFKLNYQEEALVDKILKDIKVIGGEENPLFTDATYKTFNHTQKEAELMDYLTADRTLRNDAIMDNETLQDALLKKYAGLQILHEQKSPENQEKRVDQLSESNFVNNSLKEKILLKREILKKKLRMLEEINKVYQSETAKTKNHIMQTKQYDFLTAFEKERLNEPETRVYKGKNESLNRMETIILQLQSGSSKAEELINEFVALENKADRKFRNAPQYYAIKMKFGVATNNSTYAISNFEEAIKVSNSRDATGGVQTFMPVDIALLKDLFDLCIRRDNFKGLGLLINYAEERKMKILPFDLNSFKPSLEYYLNENFKMSNIMIFLKYYTYMHECIFKEFNLTPQKIRELPVAELNEYSNFLFPYNNLVDLRDLFSYLVKKVGTNRIIDKHTKQDMMDRFVKYFTNYTVPFMDSAHLVNNFIRENDVVEYLANRFDEPNSFETVVDLALRYGDRTIYHDFMIEKLNKYQSENRGALPHSYSQANVLRMLKKLDQKVRDKELPQPNDKTLELLLSIMKGHGMIQDMKAMPCKMRNHYITEAICRAPSDGSPNFYSNQVKELFKGKKERSTPLYTACMMKALLKEGDTESALRVLDEGERALSGKKAAIDQYYIKVFDHCFNQEDSTDRHVSFFPDLLKEREARINQEIERAGQISQYEKNRLIKKYEKSNPNKKLPVSYSDFKKKHFNMVKTLKNYTQQMMLSKMVKAAIANSDYKKVNDLFTYLLVNKEEEQLRKSLREMIDAYSKTYDHTHQVTSAEEARDPLRVLFTYLKKPHDDIDALVNKYILIVPEVHNRFTKIRERKEFLHKNVREMISEHEAMFLAQSNIDVLKYVDPQDLEKIDFVLDDAKAKEAIEHTLRHYDIIMAPISQQESNYNLTEDQLTKARHMKIKNPEWSYENILKKVSNDLGTSFEDRPENMLADLESITSNQELVEDFHKKYEKNQLKNVKKSDIDRLLGSDLVRKLREIKQQENPDFQQNEQSDSTLKSIMQDSLTKYYSTIEDGKPGFTRFVNHATGETIEVNNSRMVKDKAYFVKVVADLAKAEISNSLWNQNRKNKELQDVTNGLMKSREFRKFYYFARKFYFQKFEDDVLDGKIKIDKQGNIHYDYKSGSSGSEEEANRQFNTARHLNNVFRPPKFDIVDFKQYFDKEEYDTLVKEFYQYTRGESPQEKAQFVQKYILDSTPETEIKQKISKNLRALYEQLGIEPGTEVSPSKLFGPIVPEGLAPLSNVDKKEKQVRKLEFEDRYRNEFVENWNEYKMHKLNEYLRNQDDTVIDISEPVSLSHLSDKNLEQAMAHVSEISNLIDLVGEKKESLADPSPDHIAFEYFEKVVNLDSFGYSKFEDDLHRKIYGDDRYEQGYKNPGDMGRHFEDIYELDPYNQRRGIYHGSKAYESVVGSLGDKRKGKSRRDEGATEGTMEYYQPKGDQTSDANFNFEEEMKDERGKLYTGEFDEKTDYRKALYLKSPNDISARFMDRDDRQEELHAKFSLPGRSDSKFDEYNLQEKAYNTTMESLKDELEVSILNQKEDSVKLALKVFEKIQGIELSNSFTLDAKEIDAAQVARDSKGEDVLLQELTKLKLSLEDSTSPSLSYIRDLHKNGLLGLDSSEMIEKVINADPENLREITENLEKIYAELENKEKAMVAIQTAYDRKLQQISSEAEDAQKDLIAEKNERVANLLEKEIFEAYIEYQRDLLRQNDSEAEPGVKTDYSDQHKIEVVRGLFGVSDAHFGVDLLEFGISHDIPDAVRIGENLAGLNGENVSKETSQRLKEYTLENSEKLRERIQVTGPMKGIVQSRRDRLMTEQDRQGYLPSNMKELKMKYGDKYNQWRLPSIYADDHSKRGILDSILGKERLDRLEKSLK